MRGASLAAGLSFIEESLLQKNQDVTENSIPRPKGARHFFVILAVSS